MNCRSEDQGIKVQIFQEARIIFGIPNRRDRHPL